MLIPDYVAIYIVCPETAELLLLRRSSEHLHGSWQMVTGKVEPGEDVVAAALREMHEETGLRPLRFYSADLIESFFDLRTHQIAFTACFIAYVDRDAEIKLAPREHSAYQWVPCEQAHEMVEFTVQKHLVDEVQLHFLLEPPNERLRIHL